MALRTVLPVILLHIIKNLQMADGCEYALVYYIHSKEVTQNIWNISNG